MASTRRQRIHRLLVADELSCEELRAGLRRAVAALEDDLRPLERSLRHRSERPCFG
jgi:hypothetical protein